MESLREKTEKGMFWGGLNNGVQQLLGLVFGIILGRLLTPSDYGMTAMISIFTLIATALQNSGFTAALANMKSPGHRDYNSVFWFNIIVAISLYVFLFFCAPLIAAFYRTESLIPLCRYAFLAIVLSSFGTAQSAYLFKNLMVKEQAKAGMTAVILSCLTGVTMALMDMAYWSLATQGLVFVGVNMLMQWHYSPWRPSLDIDFGPVRRMFRFSCKILATTILTHINTNVLNILLGHHFSTVETGYYNQAYQWNFKCFSLVQGMVQQVAQPVLAGLNGEDGRQLKVLRKMMRFTAFISFPLLFGFALVAEEFILLTIKELWLPSARLLQILCIGGAVMPMCTLLSNTIISKGRSGTYMYGTLALGVAQIALMVIIWPLGLKAMVIGHSALNVIWLFVWHRLTARLTGYGLRMFLTDTVPFALAAAGVMAATGAATAWIGPLWVILAVRVVVAAALYYGVMRVARVRILADCTDFLLSKIRKT